MQNKAEMTKENGKRILVFGATGSIGRMLVQQALDQQYEVTAFVRNPAKMVIEHNRLKIVQGDVLDRQSVEKSMADHDAVLICLGAGLKGTVRSEGTRHIIDAMKKSGVQRLICQSTLGVGDSRGNLNFYWKRIMFGLLLRRAFADHVAQETFVKSSGLDWTIIRPAAFTDGELTGQYKHGFPGNDKSTSLKISRADVADFMLKQLSNLTYLHSTPGLAY